METFCALLALCAANPPLTGEFPSQRPVTRSFDVFFDLRLNKRLGKQSMRSLWRHCDMYAITKLNCKPGLTPQNKIMCIPLLAQFDNYFYKHYILWHRDQPNQPAPLFDLKRILPNEIEMLKTIPLF